jgi:hypothetical protein
LLWSVDPGDHPSPIIELVRQCLTQGNRFGGLALFAACQYKGGGGGDEGLCEGVHTFALFIQDLFIFI